MQSFSMFGIAEVSVEKWQIPHVMRFSSRFYFVIWVSSSLQLHSTTLLRTRKTTNANDPIFHKRTKHTKIDCHLIGHHCLALNLFSSYMPTELQIVDLFMKSHTIQILSFLLGKLSCMAHLKFTRSVSIKIKIISMDVPRIIDANLVCVDQNKNNIFFQSLFLF